MLNFREMPIDGVDFEKLIREILFSLGYRVYWSGRGADGGNDLICIENIDSELSSREKTWLIQCKHKAHSKKSVSINDIDNIVDSCIQHNATGYLLACSTHPSSVVASRLKKISENKSNNIIATYWDSSHIERLLSAPHNYQITQRFFPKSSEKWKVYATEKPNIYIGVYEGNYFHMTSRIGSRPSVSLQTIRMMMSRFKKIELPEKHFLRLRAVYTDDKNGVITWYIDYMHPHNEEPHETTAYIQQELGHEMQLDDYNTHFFDILGTWYSEHSDHYHIDHYDYYNPYIASYACGVERYVDWDTTEKRYSDKYDLDKANRKKQNESFSYLCDTINKIPGVRIIRAINAQYEKVDYFQGRLNWAELIAQNDIQINSLFSVWLFLEVTNEEKFFEIIQHFPQEASYNYRLNKFLLSIPNENNGSRIIKQKYPTYELSLNIAPQTMHNKYFARKNMNNYIKLITSILTKLVE